MYLPTEVEEVDCIYIPPKISDHYKLKLVKPETDENLIECSEVFEKDEQKKALEQSILLSQNSRSWLDFDTAGEFIATILRQV